MKSYIKMTAMIVALIVLCFGRLPALATDDTTTSTTATASDLGDSTASGETSVKVKLTAPIEIDETESAQSRVAVLSKAALALGLDNVVIHGDNTFSKTDDGTTRTNITWHSVSLDSSSTEASQTLASPLSSQFTTETSTDAAETGTLLTAVGDWDAVLEAVKGLQEDASVTKVENTEAQDKQDVENSESSWGSNGTSSSGKDDTRDAYDSINAAVKEDTTLYSWSDCPDFVDEASMRAYEQRRKIAYDDSGSIKDQGECSNTGTTWDVEAIDGDCGYQKDYTTMTATKMVQWVYTKDEETIYYESCRASDTTYPIKEYTEACAPYIDEINGVLFLQSKYGIEVNGEVIYTSECAVTSSDEYTVYEENCFDGDKQLFDNDTANHISYPLIKRYYVLNEGEENETKVYLDEECRDSTSVSYKHQYDPDACDWQNDDEQLQSQMYATTYIKLEDGSKVTIGECAAYESPVAYAYVGLKAVTTNFHALEENEWQTFTPPAGVTKLTVNAVGGGDEGPMWGLNTATWLPVGGNAGQILTNRTISIADGEVVPVYVGKGGAFTQTTSARNLYPFGNTYKWAITAAEDTRVGDANSSFSPILAHHGVTPGVVPGKSVGSSNPAHATVYGGEGAFGFDIGDGIQAGTAERTTTAGISRMVNATTFYSLVCGAGGPGGVGYGAGGGASCGWTTGSYHWAGEFLLRGGDGAPGLVQISYNVMRYLRADNTYYDLPYNGD